MWRSWPTSRTTRRSRRTTSTPGGPRRTYRTTRRRQRSRKTTKDYHIFIPIPQISLIEAIAYNKSFLSRGIRNTINKWPCKLISSHTIWERSVSSKQCLIGLRSLPWSLTPSSRPVRPSGSSGCRGSPSGSSGRPGRRSTPPHQDLIVITYKYKDQSARMHKTGSKEIQLTTKPILMCRSYF